MFTKLLFVLRLKARSPKCSLLASYRNTRRLRIGENVSIDDFVVLRGGEREGALLEIGAGSRIRRNCYISARAGTILIGGKVLIAHNAWIAGQGRIEIDSDTIIGPNVVLVSSNHRMVSGVTPLMDLPERKGYVHIGSRCWLGANVTVLPNVTIGDNSVVGAGSVVTRDVPARSLVVGNPARVVRSDLAHDIDPYGAQDL